MSDEKPEKPEDKKEEKFDDPLEKGPPRGPILWALFLFVPIVLTLAVSLIKNPTANLETPGRSQLSDEETQLPDVSADQQAPVTGRGSQYRRSGRAAGGGRYAGCDFSRWEGIMFDNKIAQQLVDLKQPYRVLRFGHSYTKDYNRTRINVNLDEKGVITRVWCG